MPAVANTPRRTLREKGIAHAPIRIYFPGLNRIEVFGKCCLKKAGGRAPGLCQIGERWLHIADIVGGTGQEHGLFAVPMPWQAKPRMRDPMYRVLELRVLPRAATVRGDLYSADGPLPRPRQARDFVEARTRQRLAARRTRDNGFHTHREIEPERFTLQAGTRLGVCGDFRFSQVRLVDDFDSPEPFDVGDSFPAGQQKPQRVTLIGPDRFSILAIDDESIVHGL